MFANVNLWAVLVSAIASMVIGSIWFGPLFGKMFMEAMGMKKWTPKQRAEMRNRMVLSYIGQFIASLVMFYVLAGLIVGFGHLDLMGGIETALIVWIGIIVPVKFGDAVWGGKSTLFWLGIGDMLVTMLAAGIIIGIWP
jgi:hypothetical protein